ncbi:hypothetical protein TBLA_0B06620 [Henningerozyma blattae CBS 6284]|uniref:Protein kinase domain-containing protein n=1 Tax=Henningerozyma blattae (strain ATCC 34711 / CBS 6284 / DSM 70876 / NBRC 10599 / NRRL Y-10934 / UCD 77-7) TaxID=1071380 RepID=I2GZD3_HENB6|nr:hypothetical protein TBLA_0B06620 [Tetrapisispora blattae CBS 6284]CCH59485.1 hypothetical protein TBLA_0B06620 [Tetrapisispora blattae CBS 6284]
MENTNFEVIESNKENILPLKDGRSAHVLATVLDQDSSTINSTRIKFEKRILEEVEDSDDPLNIFIEYITWINHVYTQGGTLKQSGMLEVMERCLVYFKDMDPYKNDPRYLKIWLEYIELFASDSFSESRDIYIYMIRKKIAIKLTLFYEDFSQLLFDNRYYYDSYQILQMGLRENSLPQKRLKNRIKLLEQEFTNRKIDIDSVSNALLDMNNVELPSIVLGKEKNDILLQDSEATYNSTTKPNNGKYTIFRDEPSAKKNIGVFDETIRRAPWDVFDSKLHRTKENKILDGSISNGSNIGKLKQEVGFNKVLNPSDGHKLSIFRDSLGSSDPVYKIVEIQGRKKEKIDCNFNLLFPTESNEEYCIEELLAISRGIYKQLRHEYPQKIEVKTTHQMDTLQAKKRKASYIFKDNEVAPILAITQNNSIETQPTTNLINKPETSKKLKIFNDELPTPEPSKIPVSRQALQVKKSISLSKEESLPYKNVTETTTLPLNDTIHNNEPLNYNQDTNNTETFHIPKVNNEGTPGSPTMTFYSKGAVNEVYSMFNQDFVESNKDDTTRGFTMYDNNTEELSKPNLEDLTEVKPNEEDVSDSNSNTEKLLDDKNIAPINNINATDIGNFDIDLDLSKNNEKVRERNTATSSDPQQKQYMTPIKEHTEHTMNISDNQAKDSLDYSKSESVFSSPFTTQPEEKVSQQPGRYDQVISESLQDKQILQEIRDLEDNNVNNISDGYNIISDPLDINLRKSLLANINPSLESYQTFFHYDNPLKKSSTLKKIHEASKNNNKSPIVEFKKENDWYCIRGELGEGGFATVYLAESSSGCLKALKVEKPHTFWEFYILKQLEHRLHEENILNSIIKTSSLHYFQDESYLVLNYVTQGTLLDLLNLYRENSKASLEEELCIFFTIELIKVIEKIHTVGIIHGDLKPDNCMLRFDPCTLRGYNTKGENGWSHKGIFLIDFGRSFDMTLLPKETKFLANWKTDQQDCYEMRTGLPWSYEIDYYGLASIIHMMLYGTVIDTIRLKDGTFKLRSPFKRYWKQDIWKEVFSVLLNSGSYNSLPINKEISKLRNMLENYLELECSDKIRTIILGLEPELPKFK